MKNAATGMSRHIFSTEVVTSSLTVYTTILKETFVHKHTHTKEYGRAFHSVVLITDSSSQTGFVTPTIIITTIKSLWNSHGSNVMCLKHTKETASLFEAE